MKFFNKFSALIALPALAIALVGCSPSSRYDQDYDVHTTSYDYGPRPNYQPNYYAPEPPSQTVVNKHYYNNSKPSRPVVKKNYYVNNRPVSRTSFSRSISRTSRKR